jgi:hypothetical protein
MALARFASPLLALALLAAACGGGGGVTVTPSGDPQPPVPPAAAINLLFMGNSHTSFNNLPAMVAAMVRVARPGRTVAAAEAPGWMFLEDRLNDARSLQLLRSRPWTFVILQAQKYSTSGLFDYPIDPAVSLVRMSRTQSAVPIMFPEWPRRGIAETQRIFDLHVSIARLAPACVAPIGQAWDLASGRHPGLALHDADGNHSAPAGAFLAALVIANTMTGLAPGELPFLDGFGVPAEVQAQLRAIAAETVLVFRPRQWCPDDPPVPA